MVRNRIFVLAVVSVISAMILSGCGASTQLALQFSPDQSAAYKATTETIKDFRFEQPNLNKLREEQTKNFTEMAFTQTVRSVDADGTATANITIDALKVHIISKNENKFSFDSQKEQDKDAPMSKLIGKSYTITITPSGKAALVDAKEAEGAVTSSYEKKVAKSILSPEAVSGRHSIAALPKDQAQMLSVNQTWSEVVPSPPGLLAPKSYEKAYTLTSLQENVATIKMEAAESGKAVKGQQAGGGMGMFAKMFDNTDDYTGWLKIDTVTGTVLEYDETLISSYIAQEMPENGDPEKGPDTLTMQFTNRVHLEKLN